MKEFAKGTPEPLISIALKPKTKADEEKLALSLQELATKESWLRVRADPDTRHTVISGTDEVDLKNIIERLVREFHVPVTVGKPQVAYKETIRKKVEQEGKFIGQTGGRGQYGHVYITAEPLPPATGFEFVDAIKGGSIPREYIPAVEKGIKEALENGPLAGYPVIDVKVTLFDGSYHDVDSSEIAFKIAASVAFKDATRKASPVLLEPIMLIEVVTVKEVLGEVIGDLSSRRGKVLGMASRAGTEVIHAEAPLACMLGYAADIRLITQGRATYTMKFKEYVEAEIATPDPDDNEPVSVAKRVA